MAYGTGFGFQPRGQVKMGRHKDLKELRGKRGRGRKLKKQGNPKLPSALEAIVTETSARGVKAKTGGRIKQRVRKRAARMAILKALHKEKSRRKASKRNELVESMSDDEAARVVEPFSDENQSWLMPAKPMLRLKDENRRKKKQNTSVKKVDLLEGGSDGNSSEEEQGTCMMTTSGVTIIFHDFIL